MVLVADTEEVVEVTGGVVVGMGVEEAEEDVAEAKGLKWDPAPLARVPSADGCARSGSPAAGIKNTALPRAAASSGLSGGQR